MDKTLFINTLLISYSVIIIFILFYGSSQIVEEGNPLYSYLSFAVIPNSLPDYVLQAGFRDPPDRRGDAETSSA